MIEKHGSEHVHTRFTSGEPVVDSSSIFAALATAGVCEFYPDLRSWFFGKVVPGLRSGERYIVPSIIQGKVAGIAICKRTKTERKLSTLWVSSGVRKSGIGGELACKAFTWLGTSHPLFTVPEERMEEFGSLLQSWSFHKPVAYCGLYRRERVEYVFNGPIGGDTH